jgi:tetratricopeptide (TPR) repeat protein
MTETVSAAPPASTKDASPDARAAGLGWAALLVAAVVAVFARGLGGGFVYDDVLLVQDNPFVAGPGAALRAWAEPLWSFDNPAQVVQTGYWRPLTVMLLALGKSCGGQAWLYHAFALALHAAAALVALRLAGRLVGRGPLAFALALLFAVHPVQAQSVSWISAINEPLYGLFGLLALDALVAWRQRGARGVALATGLWFALALLAKEQALTVLPIAVVLDLALWWQRRAQDNEPPALLRAHGPMLAVLACYALARMVVFESVLGGFGGAIVEFHLGAARGLQLRAELLGGFLGLLALPLELPFFHAVRPVLPPGDAAYLQALALLLAWLAALVLALVKRRALVSALLLWLPLAVAPVLARYESAGAFPLSDRYLYLGLFAGAALVALGARRLLPARLAPWAVSGLALLCALKTVERQGIYADDETFYRAAVAESPTVPAAHIALGDLLLERYMVTNEKPTLDEAMLHFQTALVLGSDYGEHTPRLDPHAPVIARVKQLAELINTPTPSGPPPPDPHVMVSTNDRLQANLGAAFAYLFAGKLPPEYDMDTPEVMFRNIVRTWDRSYEAHTGYGVALMERGKHDAAQAEFARAVELNPAFAEAWFNMGLNLKQQEKFDEARNAFQKALEFRGSLEDRLAVVETAIDGRRAEIAERHLDELSAELPGDPRVAYLYGVLEARRSNWSKALAWFDEALAKDPRDGRAHLQKGKVLLLMEEPQRAIAAFGRAAELLPESFEANYNLARLLLLNEGTAAQARDYLERAYLTCKSGDNRRILGETLASRFAAGDPEYLMWLAGRDALRRDTAAALTWIELALSTRDAWRGDAERERKLARAWHLHGQHLQTLKRFEEAVSSYQRSLDHREASLWTHHNLGNVLAHDLGRLAAARPHLERALELLPDAGVDPKLQRTIESALRGTLRGVTARESDFIGPVVPFERPGRLDD